MTDSGCRLPCSMTAIANPHGSGNSNDRVDALSELSGQDARDLKIG